MGCTVCNVNPCRCGPPAPYYAGNVGMCPEDNCKNTIIQQFTLGLQIQSAWNLPQCGGSAILSVPGVVAVPVGEYLHNPSYGYFQIISFDATKEEISVTNPCFDGNLPPGTSVPMCVTFIVTPYPCVCAGTSAFFPYVAIDFTAPAVNDCIDITVTTLNGLTVGDTVQIGAGFYFVDHFTGTTIINICNQGDGITPGTPVIAKDAEDQYQYPIIVTATCCSVIDEKIQLASSAWWGTTAGSANAQTCSVIPPLTSPLVPGTTIRGIAGFTNTNNMTLNVDSVGPVTVYGDGGFPLLPNQWKTGHEYEITYAGTYWVCQNPVSATIIDGATYVYANPVVNTAAFSAIIPGGYLGTYRGFRYVQKGIFVNTSNTNYGVLTNASYGATTLATGGIGSAAAANVPFYYKLTVELTGNGSITAQATVSTEHLKSSIGSPIIGITDGWDGNLVVLSTENSAVDNNFTVIVGPSIPNAAITYRIYGQYLEFIY